jgi:hypothetical protein
LDPQGAEQVESRDSMDETGMIVAFRNSDGAAFARIDDEDATPKSGKI